MDTKEPDTNPPHQFCHHSHHQLLKWSSWFLPLSVSSPRAGTAAGSTCTYSKKKQTILHPAHPLTAWLIIAHNCLNCTFHTVSSSYYIVSHTWAQTLRCSRCYHHRGCGTHPGFPWGSLRRGHTAGRTFCSRRIQGLEAWNTNVAVRHNHRQQNIRASQVL